MAIFERKAWPWFVLAGSLVVSIVTLLACDYPGPAASSEQAEPLRVTCAPGPGDPHETWNGNQAILKGTVQAESAADLVYAWDFGDGSAPQTGTVTDLHNIAARHVYPDSLPEITFVATLTVTDTNKGATASQTYPIVVREVSPEVQVNAAIDDGLWYLHTQMDRFSRDGVDYGYWSGTGYDISTSASAILAFEIQGHLAGGDPGKNPYVDTVRRGLNYLLSQTFQQLLTAQPAGDPDSNGNGYGLYTSFGGRYTLYDAGIAAMALAASGDPNRIAMVGEEGVSGRAYKDILQDVIDYLAWAQVDAPNERYRGGWRYTPNYSSADMSVTQWPVLAMEAAEVNWGITVPAWVKTELRDHFLRYVQGTDGGFGYTDPGVGNAARTGAGLICLAFTGVPSSDQRVIRAVDFLGNNWDSDNIGNFYAMYGVMKGSLLTDPPIEAYGTHRWYEEYATYLVDSQYPDGHWNDTVYARGNHPLSTAWAVLILSPTVITPGPGGGFRMPHIPTPGIPWLWLLPFLLLIPLAWLLWHRMSTRGDRGPRVPRPPLRGRGLTSRPGDDAPKLPIPPGVARPTPPKARKGKGAPLRDEVDRGASRPGTAREQGGG